MVSIFNEKGKLLRRIENYRGDWDGKVDGKKLPTGTYYYVINLSNGSAEYKGFITIIN